MTFIVAARLFLGVGIALYGGLLLYQNRAQAVEQEHVFNRPFVDVRPQQNSGCVEDRLMGQMLEDVEGKLREIRTTRDAESRRRLTRQLKASYHPDRHAHLPMLRSLFEQITQIINSRIDMLEAGSHLQ